MVDFIRRLRRPEVDPRTYRLSDHFVLSDFLGCHSAYSKGHANPFVFDASATRKIENVKALCLEALEPLMQRFGGVSIGYGYISPDLSAKIVKYQDPAKPSHHRFDLGAAADVVFHKWVAEEFKTIVDCYAPGTAIGSPIALAHAIDYLDIPYSRMITYSESPFLCLAVSADEVVAERPRKAFYENRYTGKPKVKPDYRQYSTPQARTRAFEELQERGLPNDWRGAGYPTYHGGGFQQFHHRRVSKYTMVSDWLFDLKSISTGEKNIPSLQMDSVQDAFAAAGLVYDWMTDYCAVPRMSIVGGYVSHTNQYFDPANDWRSGFLEFKVNPPPMNGGEPMTPATWHAWLMLFGGEAGIEMEHDDDFITVRVDVNTVLDTWKDS